jgi:CubicO group peptidase (beta-lactamase class C family)
VRTRTLSRRALLGASAATLAGACIPEGRLKRSLEMTPRDIGDGWEIASPAAVGIDSDRVRAVYERVFSDDEFINALSLLIVAQGKLIAEGHIQSVTKSLTSLAFGVARANGFFPDLDAPLADFIPVKDPAKKPITLRHLMTMRSGIDVDNETFAIELEMAERHDWTGWLLDQPLHSKPGSRFDYRDCDPQLLAAAVLAETGLSVEGWVRGAVLEPLGISDVLWLHAPDGEPMAAHGVWLRARDLAKIAELVRSGGAWAGEQRVPADWISLATVEQSSIDPDDPYTEGFAYGFYFWIVPELSAYSTWGHGGTFMLVVPERDLTLVLTSMPDAGNDIGSELGDVVSLAKMLIG